MAIVAADWTIDRGTKVISYTGDDHGGASPSYATVIQFHRWVQDLADDAYATPASGDELDIAGYDPSARSTDNIITMKNGYTLNDAAMEHLYDGSIIQEGGDRIWDGIVNYGNSDVQIQIIQNGTVLSDDWWNYNSAGLNPDSDQGISHRFMIEVRKDGCDIDGRRLVGICRRLTDSVQKTFSEFKINGTARGNNVLALADVDDPFNEHTATVISGYTGITNTEGLRLIDVDNNGTNEEYYSEWDANLPTRTIKEFYERMKWITRDGSTTTVHGMNGENFRGVTHSFAYDNDGINPSTNDDLVWGTIIAYDAESAGPFTEGEAIHETSSAGPVWKGRIIALDDNGTTGYIVARIETGTVGDGDNFEGQTSGAFADVNGAVTPVTGGGRVRCLAVDDDSAAGNLYVQLLNGTAPSDDVYLYDDVDHTLSLQVDGSVTERTISTPFCGQSTGTAIIGAYGFGIQYGDLTQNDSLTALDGTPRNPPNNVTNTVGGLYYDSGDEDYVFVGPWDGSSVDVNGDPEVNTNQMLVSTALTTDDVASVIVKNGDETAIPSDTPSAGWLRVVDNNDFHRRLKYSSWTGTTFTIDTTWHTANDDQNDFNSVNANADNHAYISYLDQEADSDTESYTGVYTSQRSLVVKVRNGKSSVIKEYITSWTFTSTSQTLNAIRTTDT